VLEVLAAVPPDDMISGKLMIGLIGAIFTGLGGLGLGKKWSDSKKIKVEPSPLGVELVETLATKGELEALEERLSAELQKIEAALSKERDIARTANGKIHGRIDTSTEAIAAVRGELSQINANINRLLDLAVKRHS